MKRKKLSLITAVVLMIVMLIGSISYAEDVPAGSEGDVQKPVLHSINMSETRLAPNQTVTFETSISDSSNKGIDRIELTWTREGSDGQGRNIVTRNIGTDSSTEYQFESTMYLGNWLIQTATVYNNEGENTTYTRNKDAELLKNLDFYYEGSDPNDVTSPVLQNIRVVESNYTAPGEVTIEAEITDDKSSEVRAQVDYASQLSAQSKGAGFSNGCNLEKQSDGKYRATVTLETRYVKMYCWSVRLEDNSGNVATYTKYVEALQKLYGNDANYVNFDMDADLVPSNYKEDTTKPELISFSYAQKKITTPARLYTRIDLRDAESGFDLFCGQAYYKNSDGSYEQSAPIEVATDSEGIAKDYYCSKLDIASNKNPGDVYLDRIVISDRAGNQNEYSVAQGSLEKQLVEVASENGKYVLKTSTLTDNWINQITQCDDGRQVLCDISGNKVIPKEFFDQLKGRDITVVFEDLYGDEFDRTGIQWVINGKDIIHETKDVNMKVELSQNVYCFWTEGYKFPDIEYDQTLPEEEALENARVQQRKIAKDFWDGWKEKGYQNTDEYLNKTLDIINNFDTEVSGAIMDVVGCTPYLNIQFEDNGELPCESIVRIKPQYALRNMIGMDKLFLFYVKGEQFSKEDSGITLADDAYYDLTITHNSDYWLTQADVTDTPKPGTAVEPNKPGASGQNPAKDPAGAAGKTDASKGAAVADAAKTGDDFPIGLCAVLLLLALGGSIAAVAVRRKQI